jgi:hypothetical protein
MSFIRHPAFWIGFLGTMLLLSAIWGCDVPTDYTVHSPECPWPPPLVADTTVSTVPLGCPYTLPDGTVVPGWPIR